MYVKPGRYEIGYAGGSRIAQVIEVRAGELTDVTLRVASGELVIEFPAFVPLDVAQDGTPIIEIDVTGLTSDADCKDTVRLALYSYWKPMTLRCLRGGKYRIAVSSAGYEARILDADHQGTTPRMR